jgi:hypothetical protein
MSRDETLLLSPDPGIIPRRTIGVHADDGHDSDCDPFLICTASASPQRTLLDEADTIADGFDAVSILTRRDL